MKKLYENIEDINIKGSPSELTMVVSEMDIYLQSITEHTEQLACVLLKYSETNKGRQFEKVINTLLVLREVLYQSSIELNEMQNEVVVYQNRVFRFEDLSESAAVPNAYMVERINIDVEVSSVQFNLNEMIGVSTELRDYSKEIYYHVQNLNDSKNQIANIWMDSQYLIFSEFIENICRNIAEALEIFDEYVLYLEEKIRELN